jgi:hypothetical protein
MHNAMVKKKFYLNLSQNKKPKELKEQITKPKKLFQKNEGKSDLLSPLLGISSRSDNYCEHCLYHYYFLSYCGLDLFCRTFYTFYGAGFDKRQTRSEEVA